MGKLKSCLSALLKSKPLLRSPIARLKAKRARPSGEITIPTESDADRATQRRIGFFDLPREIRDTIYDLVVDGYSLNTFENGLADGVGPKTLSFPLYKTALISHKFWLEYIQIQHGRSKALSSRERRDLVEAPRLPNCAQSVGITKIFLYPESLEGIERFVTISDWDRRMGSHANWYYISLNVLHLGKKDFVWSGVGRPAAALLLLFRRMSSIFNVSELWIRQDGHDKVWASWTRDEGWSLGDLGKGEDGASDLSGDSRDDLLRRHGIPKSLGI